MAKKILSQDDRGRFQRDIGLEPNGNGGYKAHRFKLGSDRQAAVVRSYQLEAVWKAICKRHEREPETPRPVWDETTVEIGKAVARGDVVVKLPVPAWLEQDMPEAEAVVSWLHDLQADFPMVRLQIQDQARQEEGERFWADRAHDMTRRGQKLARRGSGQTLHQALDGYVVYIETIKYRTPDGGVTQNGRGQVFQAKLLKKHHTDMPLSEFRQDQIDAMLTYWQQRPKGKRGVMALDTCRDQIKRIRAFIKWLHRSQNFDWRRPADYEVTPVRVGLTVAETAGRHSPVQVKSYTPGQLATLYEYATPQERLYMLLALNCGWGIDMIASLQKQGMIFLDQPHGYYEDTHGDWIKRLRYKTTIYGEWRLWPATVAGLKWYAERRPASTESTFFVTTSGRSLMATTTSNNRTTIIAKAWDRLYRRVLKDHSDFPRLSFNKLKKTAGNLIKKLEDGETAGVFHCRGKTVHADELQDRYTDRDFAKLHDAIERMRSFLAPMFSRVADPFPGDNKTRHPVLSLGKIKKIKEMRTAGYKVAHIAKELGISGETVRRYSSSRMPVQAEAEEQAVNAADQPTDAGIGTEGQCGQ